MSDTDSAEYAIGDISQQARVSEADRLYDNLDYNVGFFSTLEKAITVLGGMRDPSASKLFEKIDRISRDDAPKWKRSACDQALKGIDKNRHKR
jgi:hypothetical protein